MPSEEIETTQEEDTSRSEDDIINILVATDIHLGYAEKDPIRGQDTFVTFEEILKIAVREEVDFLLLGGDLFHETRPTAYCLYKCTELLKKYCLGDRAVQIEFLSDPSRNFSQTGNETVNYEDPNLNVSLPVFSIHGNHDDPTGEYQISALNLLASSGLVNYFGKYNEFTRGVDIEPILLRKGQSKLALFGLSHIKDERLGRLFLEKKVTVMAPPEDDEWFNLLVLHQNRACRGVKTFIPDDSLPEVLDMIVWGHEHDCRIKPEETENGIFITQPGSTVATSLAFGEAIEKRIGLLKIYKKQFNLIDIPLRTVRPFVYGDLLLRDEMFEEMEFDDDSLTHSAKAQKIVEKKIDEMLEEARNMERDVDYLPLIRLNVCYTDERHTFNAIRFGQKYIDRVANPVDMVKLKYLSMALRNYKKKTDGKNGEDSEEEMRMMTEDPPSRVEDLVMRIFENNESSQLKCLSLKALNEAVKKTIDTGSDAIVEVTNHLVNDIKKKLLENNVEMDGIEEFIANNKISQDEETLVEKIINEKSKKHTQRPRKKSDSIEDSSDEEYSPSKAATSNGGGAGASTSGRGATPTRPLRGPGSRGGRGSRGPRGGRGRGKVI